MTYRYSPKGTQLSLPPASADLQHRLLSRRSVVAANLDDPGPTDEQLDQILAMAARVPDHGKLAPWRFLLFRGQARAAIGEVLAQAFSDANPGCADKLVAFERGRFLRAPLVIAVVASPVVPHAKIPEWEQILSAGAVCQNLLLASGAFGFSAQWLSEWYAYDPQMLSALGLEDQEKIAGFVYIGTASQTPTERDRPDLTAKIKDWTSA